MKPADPSGLQALIARYEQCLAADDTPYFEEEDFLQLAMHYAIDQQPEVALQVLRSALLMHPYSAELLLRQGLVQMGMERPEAALLSVETALTYAPHDHTVLALQAEALIALGRYSEALSVIHTYKSSASGDGLAALLTAEAWVYYHQKKMERMFFTLRAALDIQPTFEIALERIWTCIDACRRFEDSLRLHQELIDREPYNYLAWYNLAYTHASLEELPEAIEAMEYCIVIEPEFEQAYWPCVEWQLELQQYTAATQLLSEAEKLFAPTAQLYILKGQCRQGREQYTEAVRAYQMALQLEPFSDEAYFHLATCYMQREQWTSALRAMEHAVSIQQHQESYWGLLAELHWALKDVDQAMSCFETALELSPDNTWRRVQFAMFLLSEESGDAALAALEDEKDAVELRYARVVCLFVMGRHQEALYQLELALYEDFSMHTLLFDLVPEIAENRHYRACIDSFRND